MLHVVRRACLAGVLSATATSAFVLAAQSATPRVHAIVGARLVPAPGQVIERGTIVMRDGLITAVGTNVPVPADARVWPGDSLTVYAGLIDAFVMPAEQQQGGGPRAGGPAAGRGPQQTPPPAAPKGAVHDLECVHPEKEALDAWPLAESQLADLRAAGFSAVQLVPRSGVFRGQSAVVGLGAGTANDNTLRRTFAHVIAFEVQRGNAYPGSLMGAITVVRQAFRDAQWLRDALAAWTKKPGAAAQPETNTAWSALQPVLAGTQPALFVAGDMLEVLRAAAVAREAGLTPGPIVTRGDEYKRVREIAATGAALIVPVNFPDAPSVSTPDEALEVSTAELRHWQNAPGNAAVLTANRVTFALTANGLKDVKEFRGKVAEAMKRGLSASDALAAVTTVPARMLGMSERAGTLAPGKVANLTVTRGELFGDKSQVREVWVDGARFEIPDSDNLSMAGTFSLRYTPRGGAAQSVTLTVAAEKDTTAQFVAGADTVTATQVALDRDRLQCVATRGGTATEFDLRVRNDNVTGTARAGDEVTAVTGGRTAAEKKPGEEKREVSADSTAERIVPAARVAGVAEAWLAQPPSQPPAVLIAHATLWTAGPQGTLADTDMLVKGSTIAAIGKNLTAPAGAVVIDARGKCVAPGILDAHSHAAVLGNVNECTNIVTSEVRIQDVINSESQNIYRQLAGGTTIMHLLHGSCNAIGGQCAVIKNKWGAAPDQLFYAAAPPTIKFALGENPKQSNWGAEATGRYPQSRGGVEQIIRDSFLRAKDYRSAQAEYRAGKRALPVKPDLQLDALVEILEGRRFIHCHSYRQDEILALMRLAEDVGFRVNTFQHILEGYKVADEMATHGASASGFSDWWAYKFEVIDAIPYNSYLMWDRGVVVSINSDSDELARRLNLEAAKAVKYGGTPQEEAIKMCTINPAKQLHIDARVGSLEVGKDADFSIWTGSPLSALARCEQTWIEGRKYFDREADIVARPALAGERSALLARAKAAKKDAAPGKGGGSRAWPPRYLAGTNMSGNDCGQHDTAGGGHVEPFRSEADHDALLHGEIR